MAPVHCYTKTYQIVTVESAVDGDFAEHGFTLPGGWDYPIPDGCVGDDFKRWCEETGPFEVEITGEEYWEDDDGTVYLTYTAPAELKDRHNIDDRDEVFAKMEKALDGFTEQAVTGGSDAGASPDTPAPAATGQDR